MLAVILFSAPFALFTNGLALAIFINVLAPTLFTAPTHPLYLPLAGGGEYYIFDLPKTALRILDEHGGLPGVRKRMISRANRSKSAKEARRSVPSRPHLLDGWSIQSRVVFDYIDPTCPQTAASRRFLGWLRPA